MATTTTNLGLTLPDNGEKVSRQIINTNNTLIDNAFSGVGAKIYDVTLEVSNVSGAYSGTVYDDKITASMRAIDIYAVDPSIFNDKIHVTCQAGYLTITCDDVAGTTDVTISVLKSANDPTALTSTEFDILSNRIGDLDDLTTTVKTNVVNAVNEVNAGLATANDHIANIPEIVTNANGTAYKYPSGMMICSKTVSENVACTNSWGPLYDSTTTMSFGSWPVEFLDIPIVSANVANSSLTAWIEKVSSVTKASAGEAYLVRPTSATNTCTVHIVGYGRWK